eukprot:528375_1
MMPSIVSINNLKQTPPPPTRPHHRRRQRHDRLAVRKDINPATYYMESQSGNGTPKGLSSSPTKFTRKRGSASCMNLLSSPNQTNTGDHHTPGVSSSVMDLWSYTTSNTIAQQSYFDFMDADDFHLREEYNEFNHHTQFGTSTPGSSASNLNDIAQAQEVQKKKRHKHNKSSNLADYMRYLTMIESEGSTGEDEGERYDVDAMTTFDCVSDIFNLVPETDANAQSDQKQIATQQDEQTEHRQTDTEQEAIHTDQEGTQSPQPQTQTRPFVNKVRRILNEVIDDVPSSDNETVFEEMIAGICQEAVDNRSRAKQYRNKYKDLERYFSLLKRENAKLKAQNNQLVHRLNRCNITKDGILSQVREYLSECEHELLTYDAKPADGHDVYQHFIHKLTDMYESLNDLAQDMNSKELHNAVNKLKKGINDIEFLQHHGSYKHNHLKRIMKGLITDFADIDEIKITSDRSSESKETECVAVNNQMFEDEKKEEEEDLMTKYGSFEEECPRVLRIDIDGGWFNKKTRAIIKYRGKAFGRKEADFKWLYKMLQCDFKWLGKDELDTNDVVLPDFNKELPHTMWHDDYLMKRKRELNLFLMQCHSLKNIRSGTQYHIFLDHKKDQWKKK